MPVISTHCLANHRGGVGKTTLTYQISAAYAAAHPQCKVLVIDTTDIGDVSEMLMGGMYEKRGRETLRRLIPVANVTRMFLRALVASTSASFSHLKQSSVLADVVHGMPPPEEGSPEVEKGDRVGGIELEEFAIPLKNVNPRVPSNMYLCPTGLDIDHSIAFSDAQRRDIIAILLGSFQRAAGDWKVFIDTDTGLHGENEAYATIGLGVADFVCIPLHADMSDWYGAKILLNELQMLHHLDESHAQVHLVLWNGLNVQFQQSCELNMAGRGKCSFVPTKAEQDIIQTLSNLVFKEAQRLPYLFLYYKTNAEEFSRRCSTCMRNFGAVGVASKDIGVPIACIKPGTFHGVHMSYNLNEGTIQHCRENLEEILKAIDEADKSMNPSKRCKQHLEFLEARRLERRLGIKQLKQRSGRKRRKAGVPYPRASYSDPVVYKTYALRNKYSLRDRARKMKTKPFLDGYLDSSSTSTIQTV